MQDIIKKIYEYSLEEIMGERFGAYSKYIIQDRAIPDVRDGLKPVQRRILYAMYRDKNTYDKTFRKSAKTVGNVMGNYHPHGDSSIYDAMIRLSQDFKLREPLVEMHGNNGSIDGDTAAAMRYTEARLSKISNELLKGIDRDTVEMAPNFDDTELEPTVLPAKYPNLLVNGAMGISAGYATNIPPHNLEEVIDATIKRIDNPTCRLDTIMNIVKGPDFPTGGTVHGLDGIKNAFETGKGKIVIRSTYNVIKEKGKEKIIITEVPYEVNKANLVAKMDEIRIDKKIEGISEVRDESDRDGLQVAIDLKKDANTELIIKYLLKNTELQVSYNYNMVVIASRRPKQLGIMAIIDAYINHQKEIIRRRSDFDLATAEKKLHIILGLIKALSILDEVIKLIRKSKNKTDAKDNLVKEFAFTQEQAEAIVILQLYKLTNTDVTLLEEEEKYLKVIIEELKNILGNAEVLKDVIKNELKTIKKTYKSPRKTIIAGEIEEIKIDTAKMIKDEETIVTVTKDGYVKRTSKRSYSSTEGNPGLKEHDLVIGMFELSTLNTILLFTKKGNYLYLPVYEIPDLKWKEIGKHISNLINMLPDDEIIGAIPVSTFKTNDNITIFTKNGMVKRSSISDFEIQRYKKAITAIKLKPGDEAVSISVSKNKEVAIITNKGYALWYDIDDVPIVGVKASGVKAINLKEDKVIAGIIFDKDEEYLSILTDKGTGKRIKLTDLDKTSRAKRGVLIIRNVKSNPYVVNKAFITAPKREVLLITDSKPKKIKLTELPISDRYSIGTSIVKEKILSAFFILEEPQKNVDLKKEEVVEEPKEELKKEESSKKDSDRIMTISDYLDNFDG